MSLTVYTIYLIHLHSNLVIFKCDEKLGLFLDMGLFTFQSGDIQMSKLGNSLFGLINLHSNLVIFKSERATGALADSINNLHSNLVIFKLCYF